MSEHRPRVRLTKATVLAIGSVAAALAVSALTRVLLVTPPEEDSYWLERDLLAKARPLADVPVTQVVVPSTPDVGPTRRPRSAFRV